MGCSPPAAMETTFSRYSASVEIALPLTLLYTSWICIPCFMCSFNVGVNPITQLAPNKCNIQLLWVKLDMNTFSPLTFLWLCLPIFLSLDPPVSVGGSAGPNTTSTSLPYTWLEGGNKGQGNLHISTHSHTWPVLATNNNHTQTLMRLMTTASMFTRILCAHLHHMTISAVPKPINLC